MDVSFGYSEDLRDNPFEYADDDFLYDIKGIYREQLNWFEKVIKYFNGLNPLNRKKGSIIKISEVGIKNPESKWLKWEDIDYIKVQTNKLELSSRTGNIVNISYKIKDFNFIASKILKLANPLEALNWSKQINFKPEKTISYYFEYYFTIFSFTIWILSNGWLAFVALTSEAPLILRMPIFIFLLYLYYWVLFSRLIVSTSIQESSIIFYEEPLINYLFFSNFGNPSKHEFDLSNILNIRIELVSDETTNEPPDFAILLFKSNGDIIALIPDTRYFSPVDPIPIYYRLKSILLDQR